MDLNVDLCHGRGHKRCSPSAPQPAHRRGPERNDENSEGEQDGYEGIPHSNDGAGDGTVIWASAHCIGSLKTKDPTMGSGVQDVESACAVSVQVVGRWSASAMAEGWAHAQRQ